MVVVGEMLIKELFGRRGEWRLLSRIVPFREDMLVL